MFAESALEREKKRALATLAASLPASGLGRKRRWAKPTGVGAWGQQWELEWPQAVTEKSPCWVTLAALPVGPGAEQKRPQATLIVGRASSLLGGTGGLASPTEPEGVSEPGQRWVAAMLAAREAAQRGGKSRQATAMRRVAASGRSGDRGQLLATGTEQQGWAPAQVSGAPLAKPTLRGAELLRG